MKCLALRGYGNHGKDMEAILSESRQDDYQITAVYDNGHKSIGNSVFLGLPVRAPEALEEDYRAGLFDEVLVTVYDPQTNQAITEDLHRKGIPVCVHINNNVMAAPDTFPLAEEIQAYPEKGYRRFCFSNLYLRVTARHRIPFIFDREGRINAAYWHPYQRNSSPYIQYYRPDAARFPIVQLSGEWALLTGIYGMNYWHFTYETMDRVQLMEKYGFQGKYLLAKPSFAADLMRLAGVEAERIVWLDDLDPSVQYRLERLIYPVLGEDPIRYAAPVLSEFADTVRSRLEDGGDYPQRIYVKRIGKRRLRIRQKWLDRHGFRTIVPEELSTEEQIRYFMHADIVLSPHGANSTNSLYMKKGSVLIETFSPDYINPCCMETCKERGIYYLMAVEHRHPEHIPENTEEEYAVAELVLDSAVRAAEKLAGTDE